MTLQRTGKNWSPLGLRVWVLFYSHRHGNDIRVYGSEERVYKAAAEIVEEWLPEGTEEEQEGIKAMLAAKDYEGAIKAWQEIQYDGPRDPEEISIEVLEVQ